MKLAWLSFPEILRPQRTSRVTRSATSSHHGQPGAHYVYNPFTCGKAWLRYFYSQAKSHRPAEPGFESRPGGEARTRNQYREYGEVSAVAMTTENHQDLLAEEIRRLEDEFRSRRDNGRRMSRSVAAAYRKSIEQRAEQLRNLHQKH